MNHIVLNLTTAEYLAWKKVSIGLWFDEPRKQFITELRKVLAKDEIDQIENEVDGWDRLTIAEHENVAKLPTKDVPRFQKA